MPPKKKANRLADTIRKPVPAENTPRKVSSTLKHPSDSELTRRTTVYLSPETWEGLKIAAAKEHTTFSKIIEQLGRDYLGKQRALNGKSTRAKVLSIVLDTLAQTGKMPTGKTIAQELGVTKRTVKLHIKALKESGFLDV